MQYFISKNIFLIIISILLFSVSNISAQSNLINRIEQSKKDSTGQKQPKQSIKLYNTKNTISVDSIDYDDDLMEMHPADDLYNNIWTRDRINPYQTPPSSLPDSVWIECSGFQFPLKDTYITSRFGPRWRRMHYGTDLKLQIGDTVFAAFSGKVRIVDYEARGYGNYIVLRHNNGLETVYGHLSKVLVEENQDVIAGEAIGLGGSTGRSYGAHLHFEFRYMGNAFDTEHLVNFSNRIIYNENLLITKDRMFGYQVQAQRQAVQSKSKYYTVRSGDSISKVAARNGVSVRAITRLNNVTANTKLKAGQRLRIR
ncbi:MAG: M23 family metallopeptidase [Paludibacter sp.]|nr:M23 family metallopeptidase [Paludibacter sp.]